MAKKQTPKTSTYQVGLSKADKIYIEQVKIYMEGELIHIKLAKHVIDSGNKEIKIIQQQNKQRAKAIKQSEQALAEAKKALASYMQKALKPKKI